MGFLLGGVGGALLGAVGGAITCWGIHKQAVVKGIRGALTGAFFLLLVGPLADWFISRAPPGPKAIYAVVVGALVGGLLGVRNARRPRPKLASLSNTTNN